MSDTGTSTGDFDDQQDAVEKQQAGAAETAFVQASAGVPVVVPEDPTEIATPPEPVNDDLVADDTLEQDAAAGRDDSAAS